MGGYTGGWMKQKGVNDLDFKLDIVEVGHQSWDLSSHE